MGSASGCDVIGIDVKLGCGSSSQFGACSLCDDYLKVEFGVDFIVAM